MGEAVNKVSETVQSSDGVKDDKISHVNLYQGDKTDNAMNGYAAAYDQNNNETYLNTEGTDISKGGDIITSLFWEAQRKDNTTNGLDLDAGQQLILASSRGEQAGNLWNRFSETASTDSTTSSPDFKINSWNDSNADYLSAGTKKANKLDTTEGNGVVPRIISRNKENNTKLENYINKYTLGEYKFDENNELKQISQEKGFFARLLGDEGSSEYSKKLNEAIASEGEITLDINDEKKVDSGYRRKVDGSIVYTERNVMDWYGGGVTTEVIPEQLSAVIVSSEKMPDNIANKIKDKNNNILSVDMADTLMHELVGHAIPQIVDYGMGNAIENENRIRSELKLPLRQSDVNHTISGYEPSEK